MSRRLKLTLPDAVAEQLEELAAATGEPVARIAGRIVRDQITGSGQSPKAEGGPRRVAPGSPEREPPKRPSWLKPYDDPDWDRLMWDAIVALYRRYPRSLEGLKKGWWNQPTHVETLSALVIWRKQLDETGIDPREEISFQNQLTHYSRLLEQQGGSVTQAWKPDTQPDEWSN